MISEFKGEYRWLSNFAPAKVILDGIEYPTIENAYQAAKTLDLERRKEFLNIGPGHAKRLGKTLELREGWNLMKYNIMKDLQKQKYDQLEYHNLLMSTGSFQEIQEGNLWNDIYWGVCLTTGEGKNYLGKIIMEIRTEKWFPLL